MYILIADGACSGNPGPGGWAFQIHDGAVASAGNLILGGHGNSSHTTNNIMELSAALSALKAIASLPPGRVTLRLDSQYVLKGMFEWMDGWKKKGWRGAAGPVANREIWEEIDRQKSALAASGFQLVSQWVRGHSGDWGNESVDTEAVRMRDLAKMGDIVAEFVGTPASKADDPVETATEVDEAAEKQLLLLRSLIRESGAGRDGLIKLLDRLRANSMELGLSEAAATPSP